MNQDIRNKIIELFNLDKLPKEQQEQMIAKLGELVFQGALAKATIDMEESEQVEMEKSIDNTTTPEQMLETIKTKIPNFMDLVAGELVILKEHADAVLEGTNKKES